MSIAEILVDLLNESTDKTLYSLTAAEIAELIEIANNGYVIDELTADSNELILKLAKSGARKIIAMYSSIN